MRSFGTVSLALLTLAAASCDDGPAPHCGIALETALPAGALGDLTDARLDRAGDDFVIIARTPSGSQLRFAPLTAAGVLGAETIVVLPQDRVLGPFYGVTAKTSPGDQLLVVYGTAAPAGIALQLIVATVGAVPAPPRPLTDADGAAIILPAAPAAGGAALAMGSSATGRRAVLTYGNAGATISPNLLLLGADGAAIRPMGVLDDTPAGWSCLAITPARASFGVSRLVDAHAPSGRPAWAFSDFDDDGKVTASYIFVLLTRETGCPTVAPTPRGYTFAWQNRTGTWFANVDVTKGDGSFFTSNIAKGAVRFGGPDRQPPVACIASAGDNFNLLFDAPTPLVEQFSLFGVPAGGPLVLPARRRVGPMAAWPQSSSLYFTYFDQAVARATRRFFKVECR